MKIISTLFFLLCINLLANAYKTAAILESIKNYLPEDPNILEAGAHQGEDSIELAKFWPKGHVHAFEPVPELFNEIVAQSIPQNVTVYPLALGNSMGKQQMYVSAFKKTPDEISASSSLLEPKEHLMYAPHVIFNKTIIVPVTTIDAWAEQHSIDHIDLMWLDMQGYELHALMAGQKILDTVAVIITEVEYVEAYKDQFLFNDIKLFLEKNGFIFIRFIEHHNWCADALFVRSHKFSA